MTYKVSSGTLNPCSLTHLCDMQRLYTLWKIQEFAKLKFLVMKSQNKLVLKSSENVLEFGLTYSDSEI